MQSNLLLPAWHSEVLPLLTDVTACFVSATTRPLSLLILLNASSLVRNPVFDNLILACILVGSVLLAVNGPTNDSDTPLWRAICFLEFAFVVLFTFEMAAKVVLQGFCFCPDAYLKDPWNVLDFVVVIVGWLTNECAVSLPTSTKVGLV